MRKTSWIARRTGEGLGLSFAEAEVAKDPQRFTQRLGERRSRRAAGGRLRESFHQEVRRLPGPRRERHVRGIMRPCEIPRPLALPGAHFEMPAFLTVRFLLLSGVVSWPRQADARLELSHLAFQALRLRRRSSEFICTSDSRLHRY